MDPGMMTQSEEIPVVVVISSLMTLCVLLASTLWLCWRLGRAMRSQAEEERDDNESTGPEYDNPLSTTATEPTQPE